MLRLLFASVLMVCTALLAGCSTLATSIAAKGTGTARVYAVLPDKVWSVLPRVVTATGLDYVSGNKQEGYALAQHGMSALSYGENVAIFVSPYLGSQSGQRGTQQAGQTRVEVVSKKTFAPNILATNWEVVLLDALGAALPVASGTTVTNPADGVSQQSVAHSADDLSHRDKVPSASSYADIDDVSAIPFLRDKGRERYKTYLKAATPKAFVINQHGGWRWLAKDTDAMRKTLSICLADAGAQCWLYAVDDKVVWQQDESKRISLPQLLMQ